MNGTGSIFSRIWNWGNINAALLSVIISFVTAINARSIVDFIKGENFDFEVEGGDGIVLRQDFGFIYFSPNVRIVNGGGTEVNLSKLEAEIYTPAGENIKLNAFSYSFSTDQWTWPPPFVLGPGDGTQSLRVNFKEEAAVAAAEQTDEIRFYACESATKRSFENQEKSRKYIPDEIFYPEKKWIDLYDNYFKKGASRFSKGTYTVYFYLSAKNSKNKAKQEFSFVLYESDIEIINRADPYFCASYTNNTYIPDFKKVKIRLKPISG